MRLRSNLEARGAERFQENALADDRELIGNLLLSAGILSATDIQSVLQRQDKTGELFGDAAIALGLVTQSQLDDSIGRQQNFSVLSADNMSVDPLVVAAFNPNDRLSLEVRRLRREIARRGGQGDNKIHSLALLGVNASSERSLIAANLGVTFAQAGYRTLIVDAVLHDPHLHNLFRLPNRSGVSVVLSSDADPASVLQATSIPGLSLMTAGPLVPNVGELFDQQRLMRRLKPLTNIYDILILEVGGEVALAAGDGCNAMLMLTRRGVSDMREVRRIAERPATSDTLLLGTVLMD